MAPAKRADIKVGFGCNNNCVFCVAADKRHFGDKTTKQIKLDMERSIESGCSGIVLTGGEPTIRKDILELVSYARGLGFRTIQIQTNGRMLSYEGFCEKLIGAGANEFSPALHGHTAELHDTLTGSPGSFDQVVKGIRNLKALGQRVITNTVVTKQNFMHLPEVASLLVGLGVDQFQFAFVHPIGSARVNFKSVVPKVSEAAPYICRGLQIGIDAGKPVMAEAVPYCIMKGYEDYVSERFIPPTEIREADRVITDYTESRKEQGKTKFPQCRRCKYDTVCEGPWKEYPEVYGSSEFVQVISY